MFQTHGKIQRLEASVRTLSTRNQFSVEKTEHVHVIWSVQMHGKCKNRVPEPPFFVDPHRQLHQCHRRVEQLKLEKYPESNRTVHWYPSEASKERRILTLSWPSASYAAFKTASSVSLLPDMAAALSAVTPSSPHVVKSSPIWLAQSHRRLGYSS